jgi:AcrR family transcriptional regulator
MAEAALTAEKILVAAEDVLRRYGPAKATVVDVARALGVSHGSVYRHFASKTALREAVTRRWLDRACAGLPELAADRTVPPPDRLRAWLAALFAAKRRKALDDPELFTTYAALVSTTSTVVEEHITHLIDQLDTIITDGVASGDFAADLTRGAGAGWPVAAARAILLATARFHDPVHAADWADPDADADLSAVTDLLLAGLSRRP